MVFKITFEGFLNNDILKGRHKEMTQIAKKSFFRIQTEIYSPLFFLQSPCQPFNIIIVFHWRRRRRPLLWPKSFQIIMENVCFDILKGAVWSGSIYTVCTDLSVWNGYVQSEAWLWHLLGILYEPWHDKTNKVSVRPAKTQISLGIRHWAHSEDSDQTGQMPRLIWIFAGCICHFVGFLMLWIICQRNSSGHLV